MANRKWVGGALAVAQVSRATVAGTVEADDIFAFKVGQKDLPTAAGSTSITTTAGTLRTAWNDSTFREFAEITAGGSGANVDLTADVAGKTFVFTPSTTEANGDPADAQTFSASVVTPCEGPSVWSTADNWSGETVPETGDDVVIEDTGDRLLYDLDQADVTLASLTIKHRGTLGLPEWNAGGYPEYRPTYLTIGATIVTVECQAQQVKLDNTTKATAVTVNSTGQMAGGGLEPFLWKGTHADNVMNVNKGSVGVAVLAGETAVLDVLRIAAQGGQGATRVRCGAGVTCTTMEMSGGTAEVNASVVTIHKTGGSLTIKAGDVGTLNNAGGTTFYSGSGTIDSLTASGGKIDFSQAMTPCTVSAMTLIGSPHIFDPHGRVIFGPIIGDMTKAKLEIGRNRTITIGALA